MTVLESHLKELMHSPIHNYIVPGLTSWKIGEPGNKGMVRVFTCERSHEEQIVPHTHRFDFECIVVAGAVTNITWDTHKEGDDFMIIKQNYVNNIGNYHNQKVEVHKFRPHRQTYLVGERYGAKHDIYHSICFRKGSMVLFFEGPTITNESYALIPYVNGRCIPTNMVHDWMFISE